MPRTQKGQPAAQKPTTDAERVMVLVGLVTTGSGPAEVIATARKLDIPAELVRRTAEGLENNAAVLRQALRTLDPRDDDPDDDD